MRLQLLSHTYEIDNPTISTSDTEVTIRFGGKTYNIPHPFTAPHQSSKESGYDDDDFERQEALEYAPGTLVELKYQPGKAHVIAEYDPMMVPPIWLEDSPEPYYPHQLVVLN